MADTSTYPAALDGDLRPLVDAGTAPSEMEDAFQLVFDAVAKIETELGTNPSGAAATVAAAIAALAPLASPALTGTPTAPTAAGGTNSTQLATTAFVAGEVAATSLAGTLAARPAAGADNAGAFYLATDTNGGTLYRSNGASWVQVAAAVAPLVSSVVKGADETVNNSAVMQDDDALTLPVEAGATYQLDTFIIYTADAAADLKLGWSAPAGAALHWSPLSLNSGASGTSAAIDFAYRALADQKIAGGVGTGTKVVARPAGLLIVGGTAGSLTFQWAQNAAHASDATVYAGSLLRLERLS